MWRHVYTIAIAAGISLPTVARAEPKPSITALRGTVKIHVAPTHKSELLGLFRAGQTVRLVSEEAAGHAGCVRGWFAIEPRGFVCATHTTTFDAQQTRARAAREVLPEDRGYPLQYGTVTHPTPRRLRFENAIASDDPLIGYLGRGEGPEKHEQAAYPGMKIAWARELVVDHQRWLVTPDLHLVRAEHVRVAPSVLQRFRWLDEHTTFPFAVPLRDTAPLEDTAPLDRAAPLESTASLEDAAPAWPKTSLVALRAGRARSGVELGRRGRQRAVHTADDRWIARADVSVFARRARPAGVGEHEKWLHVRVNEGTLIAYQGDTPVFSAVISPGMHGANPKGRYRTAPGRYRISSKHLTSDMGAPRGGSWRTRAVPWVAYYDGGFALHGAWWHDAFGRPRSHGCINLTPGDARTLFKWLDPALPSGWFAVRATAADPGTTVVISP